MARVGFSCMFDMFDEEQDRVIGGFGRQIHWPTEVVRTDSFVAVQSLASLRLAFRVSSLTAGLGIINVQ